MSKLHDALWNQDFEAAKPLITCEAASMKNDVRARPSPPLGRTRHRTRRAPHHAPRRRVVGSTAASRSTSP
jgi:hypothetical protein